MTSATLITVDDQQLVFHLHNQKISYVLGVDAGKTLVHLYVGKPIAHYHGQRRYPYRDRGFSGNLPTQDPATADRTISRDTLLQEYSSAGAMDYRKPAVIVRQGNGSNALFLEYAGYTIVSGKPKLCGMPSARGSEADAATLIITLVDRLTQVHVKLYYTIFADLAVIARRVVVCNQGTQPVALEKVASLQVDLPPHNYDVITLPGAHANERQITRSHLTPGVHSFESIRGTSSHQMNPAVALVEPTTTENQGPAFGFMLVYSGNHQSMVEVDPIHQLRVQLGINPYNFKWQLQPNAEFATPEAWLGFSGAGLNGLSHEFHTLITEHVVAPQFAHHTRPIVVNNWEATYFDFNEAKLQPIIDEAQKLGIELFVLDDGWFGQRDDDTTSLGDWVVDRKKFPHGLGHLIDYVHERGLKFGLWFEPEMISLASALYRKHPEYLMKVPHRTPSPSRSQFVLDLTQPAVQKNVIAQVSALLARYPIDYVKWDMNRHLSDVYARALPAQQQGEVYHRYVLGLYHVLGELTQRFDHVLFEGCSGGGGRFDAAMAAFFPQIWTSDNTDGFARIGIQEGTSLFYPQAMISNHVSAVPNHQTGRVTPLAERAAVAMNGVFGYELDLTKLTEQEKAAVSQQVKTYKRWRQVYTEGQFFRLPTTTANETAWQVISKDQRQVIVTTINHLAAAQPQVTQTKLTNLIPTAQYRCCETKQVVGGDELMNVGWFNPFATGDFSANVYHFERVD